jgi:hypothetical protein
MPQPSPEERIVALEKEVARLAAAIRASREPGRNDWKSVVGTFANDPMMKEIDEEVRKIRELDRRRARRKWIDGDCWIPDV